MKTGRPPLWNPVASISPDVWTDVVPLASKGRVVFPVSIRNRLNWLSDPNGGILGIIEPDKSAELLPWEPNGTGAMDDVQRMIVEANASERGELALAAMDRYVRLTMDETGRAVLPSTLVAHLDAGDTDVVRVVMRDSRLWLWSEPQWQAQRPFRVKLIASRDRRSERA